MILSTLTLRGQENQELKITGTYVHKPLSEFLMELEKNYGIGTFYKEEWIKSVVVDGTYKEMPLIPLMNQILKGQNLKVKLFQEKGLMIFPGVTEQAPVQAGKGAQVLVIGDPLNQGRFRKARLSGRVFEGKSGEPLGGAVVYNIDTKVGVATDSRGRYSMEMPTGEQHLKVSFMSFENQYQTIDLIQDGKADFDLFEKSQTISEVTVLGENAKGSKTQMSMIRMNAITMKELPVLMGEADLIRAMVMMPGVQSVGEMSSGFNVRGGNTDQNLVLLDGAPVFNSTHMFGFLSMINPDAIEDVTLFKGGIPASYGERIASVMDIQMKSGNEKHLSINGGIGLINSRLTIEGPYAKKKKSTFLISGRSTYSDWMLQQTKNATFMNSVAHFYDMNATSNIELGPKNHLKLMAYRSVDVFNLNSNSLYNYANTLGSLNWKLNHTEKTVSNITAAVSMYEVTDDLKDPVLTADNYRLASNIRYGTFKYALSLFPAEKHHMTTGVQAIGYQIQPGKLTPTEKETNVIARTLRPEQSTELAAFIDDDFDLSDRLSLTLGVRATSFRNFGPGMIYTYGAGVPRSVLTMTDSVSYGSGETIKSYQGLEPRMAMRYNLQSGGSLRLSFQRVHQYINQISNNAVISPADYWKASDPYLPPLVSDQLAFGVFNNTNNSNFETSAEIYYKKLQNFLEYKNGAELIMNNHIETDLMQADGYAYGLELFAKKKTGRFNGWVSYTFSRTMRKGDSPYPSELINGGAYYPSVYDKPHDISAVANYKISRRWKFSSNFVLTSGRPITLPEQKYMFGGNQVVVYSDRNKYRMPAYSRLDLSLTLDESLFKRRMWKGSWTISVYNVLGRKNTYSVFYKKGPQSLLGTNYSPFDIYRMSIIGVPVPSITYNFRF